MKMKICQIYNALPLYRESIYKLIDATFETDWYHGAATAGIVEMDVSKLQGAVFELHNHYFWGNRVYWQSGVLKTLFKPYSVYIILGEERCLSTWLFLLLLLFSPRKKVYFWTHGPYGKEGTVKKIIQYFFYRLVDGGFVYGNYSRNILIKRGLSSDKFVTIHNSLDYDKQVALRNSGLGCDIYQQHFGNDNPTLLFIGRLTKVKKLDMLVDAVYQLSSKGKVFNLVFVGDGSERDYLEVKVKEYGLDNQVWFYGACYDEMKNAELIYNADLCVAPGNVGLTAMHTMVFGTPVISHNNYAWQMPEFEAIHPGITGDFFEMDNIQSLVDTICKWFDADVARDEVRKACFHEIDNYWNPYYQIEVLKKKLLQ